MKHVSACLWFDDQAEEAAKFYTTVFDHAEIKRRAYYPESASKVAGRPAGSLLTVTVQIEDLEVEALNGGPIFNFNPSFSFFVSCSSETEITEKWNKLSAGGTVRMGLDKYPWAERYGWTTDKFGVEWQLIQAPNKQKVAPSLLFVDELFGKGEEAINFYLSLFPNSKIESISKDPNTNSIMHCSFSLNGQRLALMEGQGRHGHKFNNAFSLMVNCDNQKEIDALWTKLSDGGTVEQCGWLKDKFGVSWQIVPAKLGDLMVDPVKADKAFSEILKMQKLDIAQIEKAVGVSLQA